MISRVVALPRRLYDWVLGWADSPYAMPALAAIAIAESSFFPIPPDVLLIALSLADNRRAFYYATVTTLSSVMGGLAGYAIGAFSMAYIGQPIIEFYHLQTKVGLVHVWYDHYGWLALAIAGFTPVPYKVFTITSGALGMALGPFALVSLLSRGGRFFLVAGLIFFFGKRIGAFIDRYFNQLTLAFGLLVILGVLALRFL